MATYSCSYIDVGKGFQFDGTDTRILYGDDFNPTDQSNYNADHCTAYQATSNFDLSGFQPGHEVGGCAFEVRRDGPGDYLHQTYWMDFERYDGSWETSWSFMHYCNRSEITSDYYSWVWARCYFGIDKDEIRPGYSKYRIHWYATDGTWDFYSPEFTVDYLNIDSTLHRSGYMWVNSKHLCYTDNTGDEIGQNGYGYKHKIAYDSSYSSYVGTDKAGYIWLDDSDLLRIYYVDEDGYRRRTYASREWFGGNVNVGSSRKGYMRVGIRDASEGYGHLCFVGPNGSKRRILNGPPAGYS